MSESYHFHTDSDLSRALRQLFLELEERLQLQAPVKVYIAGGIAVHLYTAYRVSMDVDAEFGARLYIPNDLVVEVPQANGKAQLLYFDTNSTFALTHEGYHEASQLVPLGLPHFEVYVLSPVDLAVSKLSRFADNDRKDIEALVRHGLTTAAAIQERALEALPGFVGNVSPLKMNIQDAVKIAEAAERLLRGQASPTD